MPSLQLQKQQSKFDGSALAVLPPSPTASNHSSLDGFEPHTTSRKESRKSIETEALVPDMFTSILSVEPVQNMHYSQVKREADAWNAETLGMNEKQRAKNSIADFTYLVSWWAPYCDAEALRTMVDWQNWAFAWDDQFDEGHLKEDLHAAACNIINMTSLLDDCHPLVSRDDDPIAYAFQLNWRNIQKRASPGLQHRYKTYIKHYMLGVLGQVNSRKLHVSDLTIEEFLVFRRGTIGVMPCTVLVEYALGIEVPEHIINHPSIKACQEVAVDLVLLDNDVLSYKKDVIEGEELSVIGILRSQGYTLQEAMDETGRMIEARYRRWYEALAQMPSWGSKHDRVVLKYLNGIRDIALGSLLWSFWTGRYFNKEEGELLRETRLLRLPINPGMEA
ncbi:pentalenene synthase [Colletotrichum karsti]|uniref:Terpene synthase n=1 Tax=Colletotrichum karsti TaxID=1095194 RepID=A0A9P6LMY3_9PEZI|nr:pentalenene synthase [Colletotrichum karsti]KAF9877982.1 pentalenene synthase [Colletotrichum karsti]